MGNKLLRAYWLSLICQQLVSCSRYQTCWNTCCEFVSLVNLVIKWQQLFLTFWQLETRSANKQGVRFYACKRLSTFENERITNARCRLTSRIRSHHSVSTASSGRRTKTKTTSWESFGTFNLWAPVTILVGFTQQTSALPYLKLNHCSTVEHCYSYSWHFAFKLASYRCAFFSACICAVQAY